jgi:hypothetical protein
MVRGLLTAESEGQMQKRVGKFQEETVGEGGGTVQQILAP